MAHKKIVERFIRAIDESSYIGELPGCNASSKGRGCKDKSKDILSIYLRIDDDCVTQLKYLCENCDPHMVAISDAFCEGIEGKKIIDAQNFSLEMLSDILEVSPNEDGVNEHFIGVKNAFENAIYLYYNKTIHTPTKSSLGEGCHC